MHSIKHRLRQWQSDHSTLAIAISTGLFVTSAALLAVALYMQTCVPAAQESATPPFPSPSSLPTSITQKTPLTMLETPFSTVTNPPTSATFTSTPTSSPASVPFTATPARSPTFTPLTMTPPPPPTSTLPTVIPTKLPTSTLPAATPTGLPTSTLPTATPTSPVTLTLPTATPVIPNTTIVTVTAEALNLRQGPGVQYAIMGLLAKGTVVTVTTRTPAGDWLQIQRPEGDSGWVAAMYVESPPGYDLVMVPTVVPPPLGEGMLITHGDRSRPMVALTFDACQSKESVAGYDVAIIRTLTETHTAATLFLGGLWAESHPEETRLLAEVPYFELGNHSYSHPDFAAISREAMVEEITKTQEIIYELTGKRPTLFRLPFGTYTQEALNVIAGQGLRIIQWDVVTGDPDPNISAEDIIRAVETEARNGSIIIMHMNERGWHTAEALPTVIAKLKEKEFQLVTVSELLAVSEREEP
jgi:peptidoglycan/xylan/chitin deacetylase (PgdA/CDA1 family)